MFSSPHQMNGNVEENEEAEQKSVEADNLSAWKKMDGHLPKQNNVYLR